MFRWSTGAAVTRIRTAGWWILPLALLVLGLSAWTLAGGPARQNRPIVVLVIEENNGRILTAAPDHTRSPLLAMAGAAGAGAGTARRVPVLQDPGGLRPETRVLVYHAISSGLDLVEDRLWQSGSLPFRAPMGADARLMGIPAGQQVPTNLVDNSRRLVPAQATVEKLAADGTLTLRIGDARVELKPGEQWVEGRVDRGAVQEVIAESAWDGVVDAALAEGRPLTVLRVTNLGLFGEDEIRGKR